MRHLPFLLALLLSTQASALTISGTTCPGAGCSLSLVADSTAIAVQLTGTWTGTIAVEVGNDGATFVPARAFPVGGGAYVSSFTANGAWMVPTGGMLYFRLRATSWTSGTAVVTTRPTPAVVPADVVRATGADFGGLAVSVPDGGLPVTLGGQRVAVEATGPEGGAVSVAGTVGLSGSTLTSLNASLSCTHERARRVGIGGTATPIPPNLADGGSGAMPGRTMMFVQNNNGGSHDVVCGMDPGDGGVPDCSTPGYGITLFPRARYIELPIRATDKLLCVACSGSNVPVEYLERACAK